MEKSKFCPGRGMRQSETVTANDNGNEKGGTYQVDHYEQNGGCTESNQVLWMRKTSQAPALEQWMGQVFLSEVEVV